MRITDMNWMQVEDYLKRDDRCVLPLGCTEQHAYLSLSTDSILAERVSLEAAQPLGIPVFPVLHYGVTPYFLAYTGSVSLRVETYLSLVRDILDSLLGHGFKRIVIVNGHGGNSPASAMCDEWLNNHPDAQLKFHNWWNAPRAWAKVQEIDKIGSHASWMENFPWTRLANVALPDEQKPSFANTRKLGAKEMREKLGDGNFAGVYQRSDDEMLALWRVGVEETRDILQSGWR
jgi:creatinine amidohydrolase